MDFTVIIVVIFPGSSSLSYNTPSHTDQSPRLAAKEGRKTFILPSILEFKVVVFIDFLYAL